MVAKNKVYILLPLFVWLCQLVAIDIPAAAKDIFTTSRTGTCFVFLSKSAAEGRRHPYQKVLENSPYLKDDRVRQAIAQYQTIDWPRMEFDGYPESRMAGRSLEDLALIAAMRSQNIAEWQQQMAGFLPLASLNIVANALHTIEPAFLDLVWNPAKTRLDSHLIALNQYANAHSMQATLKKAATLYGTPLSAENNFTILLNPIINSNFFTAFPVQQLLVVDLPLETKDYASILSVAFHELCHTMYAEQPPQTQFRLEGFFLPRNKKNTPDYSHAMAYLWLDEALATALGNGYFYKEQTNTLDPEPWYDDGIINRYAKAIYPIVNTWMEGDTTAGRQVAYQQMALAFAKAIPQAESNPWVLMPFAHTVVDSRANDNLFDPEYWLVPLGKVFGRQRSTRTISPIGAEAIEMLAAGPAPGVVVVSHQHAKQYKKLADAIPGLKGVLKTTPLLTSKGIKEATFYIRTDSHGRSWVIVNLPRPEDAAKVVSEMGHYGIRIK